MTVGAAFLFGAGVAVATAPAQVDTSLYVPTMAQTTRMAPQYAFNIPETGRELTGRVVSTAMDKTVVVDVERRVLDSKYGKYKKQTKKYKAHDEENEYKNNEVVTIRETRPISKDKRFVVVGRQ